MILRHAFLAAAIKRVRDGKSLVLSTGLSKDRLKAMPDYKDDRRQPSQAVTPK